MYIIVHALRYVQYADAAASWTMTMWMWTCGPRSDFAINFMEKQSFEKTESEAVKPTPPEVVLG